MKTLTRAMERFCEESQQHHAKLVIPRTTLLEFNHAQMGFVKTERTEIQSACTSLTNAGVTFVTPVIEDLVKPPDLVELFSAAGAAVVVEEPGHRDLLEAHDRACRHAPPLPPAKKSNEMRDLVIWMIAVRCVREHGSALLLSKDEVHTGPLAREEAEREGLVVLPDFDAALEHLHVQSPATVLAEEIMAPLWVGFAPLISGPVSINRVLSPAFIQGSAHVKQARFNIVAKDACAKKIQASVEYEREGNRVKATLSDLRADDALCPDMSSVHQIAENNERERRTSASESALRALREVIGGA